MVRHIVLYFLKDKSQESKEALKQKFLSMKGKIEVLKDIEVGVDFMQSPRSADVSLTCLFESKDAIYSAYSIFIAVAIKINVLINNAINFFAFDNLCFKRQRRAVKVFPQADRA
ncbi:MAG: Dabb family protein, partial [Clostridia bacterium]|nr:Dabb family protein [Clostridia bacterium]